MLFKSYCSQPFYCKSIIIINVSFERLFLWRVALFTLIPFLKTIPSISIIYDLLNFCILYIFKAALRGKKNHTWALSRFSVKALRSGTQNTDIYYHKQLSTRDIWPTGLILSNKWSRNQWFSSSNICLHSIIIQLSDIKNTFFSLEIRLQDYAAKKREAG